MFDIRTFMFCIVFLIAIECYLFLPWSEYSLIHLFRSLRAYCLEGSMPDCKPPKSCIILMINQSISVSNSGSCLNLSVYLTFLSICTILDRSSKLTVYSFSWLDFLLASLLFIISVTKSSNLIASIYPNLSLSPLLIRFLKKSF